MTSTTQTSVDGRSSRWDDHRALRRDALVDAARHAVHRLGAAASMDELAAEVGTSKSVLYRYFTDKTGLRAAMGQAVVAQITSALTSVAQDARSPHDAVRAMVDTYLAMIEHSPNVYRFVTSPPGDLPFAQGVVTLLAQAFARATGDPLTTGTVWARGAVGFIRGAGDDWLAAPEPEPRERLAARLTGWLWTGVGAGPDADPEEAR